MNVAHRNDVVGSENETMDESRTGIVSMNSPKHSHLINRTEEQARQVRNLASRESKFVWYWKFGLVATILSTALAVSIGAYYILRSKEYDDYIESVSDSC
jgi:hypothetical protein